MPTEPLLMEASSGELWAHQGLADIDSCLATDKDGDFAHDFIVIHSPLQRDSAKSAPGLQQGGQATGQSESGQGQMAPMSGRVEHRAEGTLPQPAAPSSPSLGMLPPGRLPPPPYPPGMPQLGIPPLGGPLPWMTDEDSGFAHNFIVTNTPPQCSAKGAAGCSRLHHACASRSPQVRSTSEPHPTPAGSVQHPELVLQVIPSHEWLEWISAFDAAICEENPSWIQRLSSLAQGEEVVDPGNRGKVISKDCIVIGLTVAGADGFSQKAGFLWLYLSQRSAHSGCTVTLMRIFVLPAFRRNTVFYQQTRKWAAYHLFHHAALYILNDLPGVTMLGGVFSADFIMEDVKCVKEASKVWIDIFKAFIREPLQFDCTLRSEKEGKLSYYPTVLLSVKKRADTKTNDKDVSMEWIWPKQFIIEISKVGPFPANDASRDLC